MMSAEVAIYKGLRACLTGNAALTALVPAAHILDWQVQPPADPSIILGEDQLLDGDDIKRRQVRVISTLHIWKKQLSFEGVKTITAVMRTAMTEKRLALPAGYHCMDCRILSVRYLRDPDGETAHGVMTVETLVQVLS